MSPSAGRAEQRVGDRMKHDIGVAVTGEPARVGNGNPAEHHRPFAGEGVDVEAACRCAGPASTASHCSARSEVGGRGELLQRRVAFDGGDAHSGGAQPRSFRRSERRRTRQHRRRAGLRSGTPAGSGRGPGRARSTGSPSRSHARGQRVADRQDRRRAVDELERGEQPVDHRGRAEGAGGIVDQHRVAADRGEARRGPNPPRSAPPWISGRRQAVKRGCRQLVLAFADDDADVRRPPGWPSKASTAQRSTGLPPSGRYCLGTPPPRRSPLPAATMSAVTVIGGALGALALSAKGRSCIRRAIP